jgi:predicted  nucleic acid-binding Zn-ribbon protein
MSFHLRDPLKARKAITINSIKPGQTILQLLSKAADVAEGNSRHAMDMAQKLSHQLRSAEERIAELEAEVAAHEERADRAEQWLHKVYTEIEERFLDRDKNARRRA